MSIFDDNELYSWVPDMDGDGKHSVMDLMIMEDMKREEDRRRSSRFSVDENDDDDFGEFGDDPEEYDEFDDDQEDF